MSEVELIGITFLDEKMELRVNSTAARDIDDDDDPPEGESVQLLVRDVLMHITMPGSGKPLFHLVAESTGGSHEVFYPENEEREQMALQHKAYFVTTRLIWNQVIKGDDILQSARQNFDSVSTHITVTYSTIDDKANIIEISQMEIGELDDDNEQAEHTRKHGSICPSSRKTPNLQWTEAPA